MRKNSNRSSIIWKRGKKVSLPNKVAPIIVMPHENEDDTLYDDLVMPISCCDHYDWEDNDTSYDLENLFGTCLEEYYNCYTIGASILLMMRVIMLMI